MREFMGCFVDVWQSMRLLTAGSLVRVQLEEPKKPRISGAFYYSKANERGRYINFFG